MEPGKRCGCTILRRIVPEAVSAFSLVPSRPTHRALRGRCWQFLGWRISNVGPTGRDHCDRWLFSLTGCSGRPFQCFNTALRLEGLYEGNCADDRRGGTSQTAEPGRDYRPSQIKFAHGAIVAPKLIQRICSWLTSARFQLNRLRMLICRFWQVRRPSCGYFQGPLTDRNASGRLLLKPVECLESYGLQDARRMDRRSNA